MWNPPPEERVAERDLVTRYSDSRGGIVVKLQKDNDDGGTDGIFEVNHKRINVEARRKGYPNHSGELTKFSMNLRKYGWSCLSIKSGIYLNELTIENYKDDGFDFVVEIYGCPPRACEITPARVAELLKQPRRLQKSWNSGSMQSVKLVPLEWFKEF